MTQKIGREKPLQTGLKVWDIKISFYKSDSQYQYLGLKRVKFMYAGMPNGIMLEHFGHQIYAAFGEIPYVVGSSLHTKQWRDIDVRLILPDEKYKALGLGDPDHAMQNSKWVSLVLAYSALGKSMTGLPIDFQIQQQSKANQEYEGPRSALGILIGALKRKED